MTEYKNYADMKAHTHRGFNTWSNSSVMTYSHLPDGFAVTLGFKEYGEGRYLNTILLDSVGDGGEVVKSSFHSFSGSYCEIGMKWKDCDFNIQASCLGDELYVLVTPLAVRSVRIPALVLEAAVLWRRPGYVDEEDGVLTAHMPEKTYRVYHTGSEIEDPAVFIPSKYQCIPLSEEIGISVGKKCTADEIRAVLARERSAFLHSFDRYGEEAETFKAMQSCLAWNTIYDPVRDRIVSPVSRVWSRSADGCMLFCWDTYFAALMAMPTNREIAYSNAIEISADHTEAGFVPNAASSSGFKTRDRSEPPVGGYVAERIYEKYGEKWFLEEVFDNLYNWNRWWFGHRQIEKGLFAWGADHYEPVTGHPWEFGSKATLSCATLESGLDNSPMYEDAVYDPERHMMLLADVGLTSMLLLDCASLEKIALVLGRKDEARLLHEGAADIGRAMEKLWDEEDGFYYNYDYAKHEFSRRKSPTHFYALFNKNLPAERVRRILQEHFFNENEFFGTYMIPSISKDDPAFPDNNYWRGRIWGPMNLLVYAGLMLHDESRGAAHVLALKSRDLILKEWLEKGHVHENYNALTGEGCDGPCSGSMYHWGGLLSYVYLDEAGLI